MKISPSVYKSKKLPAMQNKLFLSKSEALSAPFACLDLCQDETGLIFNQLFNPDKVTYDENYQNEQGYSKSFRDHLDKVINLCNKYLSNKKKLVVDIGCGKGCFVEMMRDRGFNAIGYDNAYQGKSSYIKKSFFSVESHDRGELLTLRHVLEHIPSPWKFLEGIAEANSYNGLLYIEVPDLDWILNNKAYFDLFHEHVNYFRAQDFINRFSDGVIHISNTFGGQYLSIIIDLTSVRDPEISRNSESDELLKTAFSDLSKHESQTYESLEKVDQIVIWGAASKGVVFASKAPKHIEKKIVFAIDISPEKHNQYMPISALKVLGQADGLAKLTPSTLVLIMNPNYESEIRQSLHHSQPFSVIN